MEVLSSSRVLWNMTRYTISKTKQNLAATSLLSGSNIQQSKFFSKDSKESGGDGRDKNHKQNLLAYPVLPLNETLNTFLKSCEPLLTPEEFKQQKGINENFLHGAGGKLQELLEETGKREKNWLADRWLKAAYLQYRDPVTVYSSPGMTFPFQKFSNTKEYLNFTAKVIYGMGEFKNLVDDNKIPVVKMGKYELDNGQFSKVLGTCRIPTQVTDKLVYNPNSTYVVVIYMNHFYKLPIYNCQGKLIKANELSIQLEAIMKTESRPGPPIGLLTTDTRDNWAEAYERALQQDGYIESFKTIQESLFTVSLDQNVSYKPGQENNIMAAQLIHGGGSKQNSANRWMDKTIQLIVNPNGMVGFSYEHSPAEGQPIAMMMDYVVKKMEENKDYGMGGAELGAIVVEKIVFTEPNKCVDSWINIAEKNVNRLAQDLQLQVVKFKEYGKDFIKRQKLGPDSYVQMAIQLAFYKMHKVPAAQYESAHLRIFDGGRTETIRSCSTESTKFVKAMSDSDMSAQDKAKILRTAVSTHQNYTRMALQGKGVDRHLLGLKLMALENCMPIPDFYKSPGFVKSTHFRVSTSQVASLYDAFMCYGPLTSDGYGCCYNPRENDIIFNVSAWQRDSNTCAIKFGSQLVVALRDMKQILERSAQSKL